MLLSFLYLVVRRLLTLLIPGDEIVRSAEVEVLILRHRSCQLTFRKEPPVLSTLLETGEGTDNVDVIRVEQKLNEGRDEGHLRRK